MDEFLQKFQETNIAAWNEKDKTVREDLLENIYASDMIMYDAQNVFYGRQAIADFIGKLLTDDPAFIFSGVGSIEPVQNAARLIGQIRTSQMVFNSMDFFIFNNNKVQQLYVFMEPVV